MPFITIGVKLGSAEQNKQSLAIRLEDDLPLCMDPFIAGLVQAVAGMPNVMFPSRSLCWPVEQPYPNAP